ncbi:unnamed protein product, partial [Staurois parvus]
GVSGSDITSGVQGGAAGSRATADGTCGVQHGNTIGESEWGLERGPSGRGSAELGDRSRRNLQCHM